jgi:hypothetical protein
MLTSSPTKAAFIPRAVWLKVQSLGSPTNRWVGRDPLILTILEICAIQWRLTRSADPAAIGLAQIIFLIRINPDSEFASPKPNP